MFITAVCVLFFEWRKCRIQGRFPFNQKFRKFRYRIKWNGDSRKIYFENFGQPLEVVAFPGNLEIPGIFCSIGHSISLDAQSQFLQP